MTPARQPRTAQDGDRRGDAVPGHAGEALAAAIGAAEGRRRSERRGTDVAVRVVLPPAALAGRADNLSTHGVFFFTSDALRVRIEIEGEDGVTARAGRIVRVQTMSEDETGFAIEFDR